MGKPSTELFNTKHPAGGPLRPGRGCEDIAPPVGFQVVSVEARVFFGTKLRLT